MPHTAIFHNRHLLGLMISGALMLTAISPSAIYAQESREISKTIAFSRDGRISVKGFKGSIKIKTWDQAQVDIQVRIEADGSSRREVDAVATTEIYMDESRDRLYIATDYDRVNDLRNNWGWHGGVNLPLVHYTLTVPQSVQLDIEDHKSEIEVNGLKAPVRISSHKGPMTIKDIETHKARVNVTGLNGSLDLRTHESDVEVEFVHLADRTRIETHKGDIALILPEKARFDLDAEMGRKGDFRSDFDVRSLERQTERRNRDLEYRGPVNGGGPLLSLRTDKGYYRIHRR